MNNPLLFDFTVDKASNSIFVNREFAAGRSLVWDAFTKPEILDQWGAPAPWRAETISMDFRAGGRRFYKMVSPEGLEHFSVQDFTSISRKRISNISRASAIKIKISILNSMVQKITWISVK